MLQSTAEEMGRVPHIRPGVCGPKTMGAAQRSLLSFDQKIPFRTLET